MPRGSPATTAASSARRFLPTTVVQYLRPDTIRFERLLPIVRFGPLAHEYGSYPLETNTPSVVAHRLGDAAARARRHRCRRARPPPAVGPARRARRADRSPRSRRSSSASPPTATSSTCCPALAVPAAFAAVTWRSPARQWVRTPGVRRRAGVVWGAWVNVALATWTQQLKSPGFTAWRYEIDDALFGGSPPRSSGLTPDGEVPRDGVVGIDGPCVGLYIAEQGKWVALERSAARSASRHVQPGTRRHRAVWRRRRADAVHRRRVRDRTGHLAAHRR